MADTFTVERSGHVAAPPPAVFEIVADFHLWPRWSPWEELDPDMERTHSGAPTGTGAAYAWAGNRRAGAGRMEITSTQPPGAGEGSIDIALVFSRPFKSANTTRFTFTPEGDGTHVHWSMTGKRPLMMRLLPFLDMDKLVGKDFEKGLAKLDAAVR
jgi:uncharacterized protein YndB with AHSA1/START domain